MRRRPLAAVLALLSAALVLGGNALLDAGWGSALRSIADRVLPNPEIAMWAPAPEPGSHASSYADATGAGANYVYLVDAADDLRADIKSGGYNPLALRFTPKDGVLTPADSEVLALTLDGSVRTMAAAFELLPETKYTPVLRAAVYEGLYAVGAAVLHGTFRKRQRREEPIRKADTDYA